MKILSIKINDKFDRNKPSAKLIKPDQLYKNFVTLQNYLQLLITNKESDRITTTKILECIYILCEIIERFDKNVMFLEITYKFNERDFNLKNCWVNINELRNYFYHHLTLDLISHKKPRDTHNFLSHLFNFISIFELKNKKSNLDLSQNTIINDIVKFAVIKSKNYNARWYLNRLIANEVENNDYSDKYSIEEHTNYIINDVARDDLLSSAAFSQVNFIAMYHEFILINDKLKYVNFNMLIKNKRYHDIFILCAKNKLTRSFKIIKDYYNQLQLIAKVNTNFNKKAFIFCISKINSELRFIEKINLNHHLYDTTAFTEIMKQNEELINEVHDFRVNSNFKKIISLLRHGHEPVESNAKLNSIRNAILELKNNNSDTYLDYDKSDEYTDAFSCIQHTVPSFLFRKYSSREEMCENFLKSLHRLEETMKDIDRDIDEPQDIKNLSNFLFSKIALLSQLNTEAGLGLESNIRTLIFSPLFHKIVEPNLVGQWIEDRGTFLRSRRVEFIQDEINDGLNHLILESKNLLTTIKTPVENINQNSIETYFYPSGAIGNRSPFYLTQYPRQCKENIGVKFYTDKGFTHSVFQDNKDTPKVDVTLDTFDDSGKVNVNISMLLNGNNAAIFFREKIISTNTQSDDDVEEKKLAHR